MPRKSLVLLVFFAFLVGCRTERWSYSRVLNFPYEDVWNASYKAMEKKYDILQTDENNGEIDTDWELHLAPFFKEGYRYKVRLRIEVFVEGKREGGKSLSKKPSPEDDKKAYIVKVQAPRERNDNIDRPSNSDLADWSDDGYMVDQELWVIGVIQRRLYPYGIKDGR